ncbi:MAG: DUF7670 domain-containing protein [Anaerolineales bacterium]
MSTPNIVPTSIKITRWIARIWSILVFVVVLFIIFTPDPYATEPIPFEDWFLLSLWGVVILGLLVAWRWELVGGIITIVTLFIREIAWIILKGGWMVSFLIVWLFIAPPAILFLLAWGLERKANKT